MNSRLKLRENENEHEKPVRHARQADSQAKHDRQSKSHTPREKKRERAEE